MPEGDTIHRVSARLQAALAGRAIERAEAPSPRSPLRRRAAELEGATLERAEARGKHLLLHFSGDRVVHSHLGVSGRWSIAEDGADPRGGSAWLLLGSGPVTVAQAGGKLLRLGGARRIRNDPVLLRLGPDPLAAGFDPAAAADRLLAWEPSEEIGSALLDQELLAGVGNVIRIEACFATGISPWRRVGDLDATEAEAIVTACREIMLATLSTGRRPKRIYGAEREPCPRCGGRIATGRQGESARRTVWCPGCQR